MPTPFRIPCPPSPRVLPPVRRRDAFWRWRRDGRVIVKWTGAEVTLAMFERGDGWRDTRLRLDEAEVFLRAVAPPAPRRDVEFHARDPWPLLVLTVPAYLVPYAARCVDHVVRVVAEHGDVCYASAYAP